MHDAPDKLSRSQSVSEWIPIWTKSVLVTSRDMLNNNVIIIVYTTLYRKGGAQFPIVARTLASEKAESGFKGEIITRAVESKRDVLKIFAETRSSGKTISEFHFVGHSGMYGPMFGTIAFPEQFSPYEWETMDIPFTKEATAHFHCCRSARWFAPFFSRTFNVKTFGFFWYTTFSRSWTRYRYAGSDVTMEKLYTIGCKGRKSHGMAASFLKFVGLMPAEEMKSFEPQPPSGDTTYDHVAELYDHTFEDIRVRKDECEWLNKHLSGRDDLTILDIGCGNGALLNALSTRIKYGAGVDESEAIIERARKRNAGLGNLKFARIDSPTLPFEDATFDVVISLMSFRYLDWDPLLKELRRVIKPGGWLLIVDMVTDPVKPKEYSQLIKDKIRTLSRQKTMPTSKRICGALFHTPTGKKCLNTIRYVPSMK